MGNRKPPKEKKAKKDGNPSMEDIESKPNSDAIVDENKNQVKDEAAALIAFPDSAQGAVALTADAESNSDGSTLDSEGPSPMRKLAIKEESQEEPKSNSSTNTGARPKVNKDNQNQNNKSTKEENQRLKEKAKEVEMTQLTATVYLAAPTGKRIAVTGSSGGWKNPQGSFRQLQEFDSGFGIFQGVIPIPPVWKSSFKFVQVESDGSIKYEGDTHYDNRDDELLPDAMYFFIYKPSKKTTGEKLVEGAKKVFGYGKTETTQKVLALFLDLAFNRALEQASSDWDTAIDIIKDCLEKLQRLKCTELRDSLRKFVSDRLQLPELLINFDHLFLLIVGAHLVGGTFPTVLQEFLMVQSVPFSLYLHQFKNLRRNGDFLFKVLETLALQGPDYCWIVFRLNRHNDMTRNNPKAVTDALIKIMRVFPEALLSKEAIASRVASYLFHFNDVDDIYDRLLPVLREKPDYKNLMDRLLLGALVEHERTVDEATRILRSRFVLELLLLKPDESPDEESLKNFFLKLFNRKSSDVVMLATFSPERLLPFVRPIVESTIQKKMQGLSHFNRDDYQYFAQLDSSKLVEFPETQKRIDETCMRMSKEHVRLGNFQNVPSLKLILRSLAEMGDHQVPFLERPSFVDLQKAVTKLPRKYFQNLHTALKSTSLKDKNLKNHRKGETKDMVDRMERHIDVMEEILVKVRTKRIALNEITCLQDLHVSDYLKYLGIADGMLTDIRKQVEELKKRQKIYGGLYNKFARYSFLLI